MRISNRQLQQIIKEETLKVLKEATKEPNAALVELYWSIVTGNKELEIPKEDIKKLQNIVHKGELTGKQRRRGGKLINQAPKHIRASAAKILHFQAKKAGNKVQARRYLKYSEQLAGLQNVSRQSSVVRAADAFFGVGLGKEDKAVEMMMNSSPVSPDFAKGVMYIATGFKARTGINILDPTMPRTKPAWAKKYPDSYAVAQFVADMVAGTPFDAVEIVFGSVRYGGKAFSALIKRAAGPHIKKMAVNLNETSKAIAMARRQEAGMSYQSAARENIKAKEVIKNIPVEEAEMAIMIDVAEEVFHSEKKFVDWVSKHFKDIMTPEKIAQNKEWYQNMKKLMPPGEGDKPLENYLSTKHQFYKLLKRFNAVVDEKKFNNAWAQGLYATGAYRQSAKRAHKLGIPVQGPVSTRGIGIGTDYIKKGGKKLYKVMMHEIGHIKFWKHNPVIGKAFLKEYKDLLNSIRASRLTKLAKKYNKSTDEILRLVKTKGDELSAHADEILDKKKEIADYRAELEKHHAWQSGKLLKQAQDAYKTGNKAQTKRLINQIEDLKKEYVKDLDDLPGAGIYYGKVSKKNIDFAGLNARELKFHNELQTLHIIEQYHNLATKYARRPLDLFSDEGLTALQRIKDLRTAKADMFGRDSVKNLYYLDPEETFAELFEKTSSSFGKATSKNFSETVEQMNDIVVKEIMPDLNIKESLTRRKKILIETQIEKLL